MTHEVHGRSAAGVLTTHLLLLSSSSLLVLYILLVFAYYRLCAVGKHSNEETELSYFVIRLRSGLQTPSDNTPEHVILA